MMAQLPKPVDINEWKERNKKTQLTPIIIFPENTWTRMTVEVNNWAITIRGTPSRINEASELINQLITLAIAMVMSPVGRFAESVIRAQDTNWSVGAGNIIAGNIQLTNSQLEEFMARCQAAYSNSFPTAGAFSLPVTSIRFFDRSLSHHQDITNRHHLTSRKKI